MDTSASAGSTQPVPAPPVTAAAEGRGSGPPGSGAARRALPVAVAAGFAVLALVVGFGPGPLRLPGLPSSGTVTYWALPCARLAGRISSVATLGWLLTAALLLPARRATRPAAAAPAEAAATAVDGPVADPRPSRSGGRLLTFTARRCGRHAANAAVVWLLATLAELVFSLSEISARPIGDVLDLAALRSFVAATAQGRALLVVAAIAAVVAIVGRTVTTTTAAGASLTVAAAGLLPPVLAGHAATSGDHAVAVVALAVHVLAASAWIGGLLGLLSAVRLPATSFGPALRRHSRFAAGAAALTAASGIGGAALRLGSVAALWQSRYGLLVLLKVLGLVVAVALGGLLRRRVVDRLAAHTAAAHTAAAGTTNAGTTRSSTSKDGTTETATSGAGTTTQTAPGDTGPTGTLGRFVRLAGVELMVLTATLGLAVGLSRTAPPVNDAAVPDDPTRALLGYPMPPPVTAVRLATDWRIDWVFLAGSVLAAGLYLAGLRRLAARGDRWPLGRTVAWFVGLFVTVVATSSGLGLYGPVLLSVHMTQHMLLNMLAPIPLVLGAPVTLALRALRPAKAPHRTGPREWLVAALRSWPVRFLTHPLVVTVNFVGGLYVLYLTSLLTTLMRNHLGHLYMNVHFLAVGLLFFELIIGIDPLPRRLSHPSRILMLLAVVPFHTFLGLTIMGSSAVMGSGWYDRLVRPWGVSPLSDQHTAGGIAWSFGELPTFTVLLVLVAQWARTDERRNRTRERRIAAAGDVDAELDAYNAYLARLDDAATRRAGGTRASAPSGVRAGRGPANPPGAVTVRPPRPRDAPDDGPPAG
ncbi:cytochrome c oxidase assembly protein [Frankia sp. AgB32]|uniref:cytochrome c oxidase assembly protein n=1 Tax=Frankia sp. AgB32 TaxID=631119 RepID=UPI00200FD92A|nr:cytochrome c oxidase assembly protein [Frankia sp. AgB32]MCK9896439.1 cytochrome c oxidase assembly protein [Frankia sp. AgB32]